jgi:2-haloacid dehalogenase
MALFEVKALTFDVFGTVVNWRDSIAREAKSALAPKGYDKDWHSFADRWRARYQPAMDRVRKGERPWVKLDDLHRENLIELLQEFGIGGLGETDIDHLNAPGTASPHGRTRSRASPASSANSSSRLCRTAMSR